MVNGCHRFPIEYAMGLWRHLQLAFAVDFAAHFAWNKVELSAERGIQEIITGGHMGDLGAALWSMVCCCTSRMEQS